MRCSEVSDRLDDLLDGSLGAARTAAVRDHLASCPRCASELDDLERIRARVAELPRDVHPPHDLWPGIAGRIERAVVVRARFRRHALKAAAAVLLVAGSVVTGVVLRDRGSHQPTSLRVAASEGREVEASLARLGLADAESARRQLLEVLDARSDELSPQTRRVLEENLRVIDDAMAKIAAALQEDPDSELLLHQLAAAYRQQVGLLERAARLPSDA